MLGQGFTDSSRCGSHHIPRSCNLVSFSRTQETSFLTRTTDNPDARTTGETLIIVRGEEMEIFPGIQKPPE